jgi:FkbM family methyltransferase
MPKLSRRELFIGAAAGATGGVAGIAAYRNGRFRGFLRRYLKGEDILVGFPPDSSPSYAESGDDVLARLFLGHISKPSYLDIGAWYPIKGSNTYLFYAMGGRGVLVEPNINLIPELEGDRPGDTVLNIGIGVTEQKEADYYCYSNIAWNTFDKKTVDARVEAGQLKPEKVIKLPLVPINRVIEEHFHGKAPDFLSIDVEGLDLAILKTLDFLRFRPKVICAETFPESDPDPETTHFLTKNGYKARAVTYHNTIYVDKTMRS